jgi:hypothetical protein
MPTINTFPDPRLQAVADYMSVLQYQRLQDEIRREEERARQKQLTGTLVGAGVGALTGGVGLGLGAAGAFQGAAIGGQAGAQFGSGDIAGGALTALGGIGQGLQARQDIQDFGFAPTPLDRKEISKLASSLDLTTRQATTQAKQAGMGVGPYLTNLAQQQDAQRQKDTFLANMGSQLGVEPGLFEQIGQGNPQVGIEQVRAMREEERQQRGRADARTRMNAALQQAGILDNFDLVPDDETAHQAVRHYNAVMGDPNVPNEQRIELLNRVASDIEDPSNFPMKLTPKQPPSAAEQVQSTQPLLEAWTKAGYDPRVSIGQDGKMTVSVTAPKERESDIEVPGIGTIPRSQFMNRLNENFALGVSMARPDDAGRLDYEDLFKSALNVTIDGLIATDPGKMQQLIQERLQAAQAGRPQDITAAVAKLETAVQESPNIETWTPEQFAELQDEALAVADAYIGILRRGREQDPNFELNETQSRRLAIARRILEQ